MSLALTLRTATARPLAGDDAAILQALLVRSAAYFRGADGRAPSKHAALERISDALGDAQVALIGLFRGESLVGFLELRLDEPREHDATIVLLLLEPAERRKGLGREVVEALVSSLSKAGTRAIHLGVQDHEHGARAFWEAQGFVDDGRDEGVTRFVRKL
ncbi:MAG: GNAT family N-acetyltransferase [Deltaproteobacteria bacterium]|nr:GNAT family N-acetyltransferase [Deltaproteobacteria bacterium]